MQIAGHTEREHLLDRSSAASEAEQRRHTPRCSVSLECGNGAHVGDKLSLRRRIAGSCRVSTDNG